MSESIALGPWGRGQSGAVAGGPLGNPLGLMGDVMKLRQTQQEWNARQAFGNIMAGSGTMEEAVQRARQDPNVSAWMPQLMTEARQQQLLQYQVGQVQQEIAGKRTSNLNSGLDAVSLAILRAGNDPDQLGTVARDAVGGLDPLVRRDTTPLVNDILRGLTGNLAGVTDPAQRQALYAKNLAQFAMANKYSPDQAWGATTGGLPPSVQEVPTPTGAPMREIIPGGAGGTLGVGGGGASGAGAPSPNALSAPTVLGTGPGKTEAAQMEHRGADMADYQKKLDENVNTGATVVSTINPALEAMNRFKPGAGASTYLGIAQVFQAMGAKQDLYDKIAGGDMSAAQEMQKLMLNTTMGQIRSQVFSESGSRLNQQEFSAFLKNNPGIDTDPRATKKIFDLWTKFHVRDRIEQKELNNYLAQGGPVSNWPAKWQQMQGRLGLREANIKAPNGQVIKPASVLHLLDNPDTAEAFDQYYGSPGAAEKFLGR